MIGNFGKCLPLVLAHEGGWADHPADPGGATMKGVTLRVYQAYSERQGRPMPGKAELRKISDADVASIYRRQYWDAVRGDELPSGLDLAAFDFAVNSGPGQAAKELQRVVGATADGKVGMLTLDAVRAACMADADGLIGRYQDRRMAFLKKLKGWGTFGKGWTRRVEAVRRQALAMAAGGSGLRPDVPPRGAAPPLSTSPQGGGSVRADPAGVAVTRTKVGGGAAATVAGAVGTAVAASADRVLETAAWSGGSALMIGVAAFVVLTVAGGLATAWALKRKAAEEGTV